MTSSSSPVVITINAHLQRPLTHEAAAPLRRGGVPVTLGEEKGGDGIGDRGVHDPYGL